MDISNEDADAILVALVEHGFMLPFRASIRDYPDKEELKKQDEIAWEGNRNALRLALESTDAWNRYRIY